MSKAGKMGTGTASGSVRIIGGQWRRRRIPVPPALDLRPTPDRVRETLFNWLEPRLQGAHCLDLFAGTGVLGFEALSRGAARAVLVERDRAAAAALETSRDAFAAAAEIVCDDALACLAGLPAASFDIVFVDPPYARPLVDLLTALPRVMKPDARVYVERARGDEWPAADGFDWLKTAAAAGVRFGLAAAVRS